MLHINPDNPKARAVVGVRADPNRVLDLEVVNIGE
jgi:hypothetical protein